MMANWQNIPNETPMSLSGLRPGIRKRIVSRHDLNLLEGQNIRLATVKYLAATPSHTQAPFTLTWAVKLHKEMFQNVWSWAGQIRNVELNLGLPAVQIREALYNLLEDLRCWEDSENSENSDMPLVSQGAFCESKQTRSVCPHVGADLCVRPVVDPFGCPTPPRDQKTAGRDGRHDDKNGHTSSHIPPIAYVW